MFFRFFLILGIIAYVLYKVGSFFFRAGAASQQLRNYERQQQQQAEREKQARKSVRKDRRGGEYIDYEEVK
jgi:hypothetical protein